MKCKKDQVLNPYSGRCVLKTGALGRQIMGLSPQKSPKKLESETRPYHCPVPGCMCTSKTEKGLISHMKTHYRKSYYDLEGGHDFPYKFYRMKIYYEKGAAHLETPSREDVEIILSSPAWKAATSKYLVLVVQRGPEYDTFYIRPKDRQFKDEPEIISEGWDPENMQMGYDLFKGYSGYLKKGGRNFGVSMQVIT